MISRAEIQRVAGSLGVDPQVIDQDYALGCFLNVLSQQEDVKRDWIFKGGTALAKCYFADFRFSEDLDFTISSSITAEHLRAILETSRRVFQEHFGIRADVREPSVEPIEDEYGKESFEGKIYFHGPWMFRGDPRAIRVHLNREDIVFPATLRNVFHRYSDAPQFAAVTLRVYALEEVFVEKLRAFSGQRRNAVARDIFDLHFVSTRGVNSSASFSSYREKCEAKGLDPKKIQMASIKGRKEEYEINWQRNLEYLLPNALKCPFEEAWGSAISLLEQAVAYQ
ncbi:MAG: nucleotidyl transferase AbiEii/AbiGii toxin family protein [Ignavibacteria bacterium]|nr:nucleotidyl transferase AbiEii/AbiGii toxin family protein [Ignavibacteria bacterium]